MEPIIEVRNLGKKYDIRHQQGGYIALRDVIMNVLKSPFAFAKDKAKKAIGLSHKDEFWALKGVDFSVNRGEVMGIIGANGAGKSTLLKILTGITLPTEGQAILRGHVSSLLEVGTGFHPELTGRENIFLNGAILGMKKVDIEKRFDSIVEFAGIEKFLDTPVKRYSSGMYVRLAFSVAAHIEPDILLVDEVLAVGDAEFQKKCLGKMDEVTKKQGRTILFVSHNLPAIQSLCQRSILLENGQISMIGKTSDVIGKYLSKHTRTEAVYQFEEQSTKASINKVSISDSDDKFRSDIPIGKDFNIDIEFECKTQINHAVLSVLIFSQDRELILYSSDSDTTGKLHSFEKGIYKTTVKIPAFLLNVGKYYFDVLIHSPSSESFGQQKDLGFEITNIDNPRSVISYGNNPGRIALPLVYKTRKT